MRVTWEKKDSVVQTIVGNLEVSKVYPISLLKDSSNPLICKYASYDYSFHQQLFIKCPPCIRF